jgi:hypothetical protein
MCGLLLLAGACGSAFGQRKPERASVPAVPPPAVAREVTVRRGEGVVVPLGIHGVRGGQLEFLIRTKPRQGSLGDIQTTGKNTATVTYRAAADANGEDRFYYAVRSPEGVSAPAAVTVKIAVPVMLPVRLDAPEVLNFPEVFPGGRSTAMFDLKNTGGGVAEGELKVEAPWSLDGIPRYRLASGESVRFKLVFQPEKAGDFNGEAVMGPAPRRGMTLAGTARAPFSVSADKIELTPARGSQTRRAVIRIENRTAEPRKVTLAAGRRLLVDQAVELPAKGGADVAVFADAADVSGFEDTLRVEAPGWSVSLPVRTAPLGAMLRFAGDPPAFAAGAAGARMEGSAVIENTGGEPAAVTLRAAAPFVVLDETVALPPKGRAEVRLAILNPAPGRHAAELVAEYDGASVKLPLTAEVASPPVPASTPPEPGDMKDEPAPVPAPAVRGAIPPPAGLQDFPNGRGNFARDVKPASAALEWPRELGPAEELRVEERVLSLGPDGGMVIDWKPMPRAVFRSGSPMRAELPGLTSGRLYTVRVVSGAETVFTAQFGTPVKPPFIDIGWRGGALIALFAVLAALGWWKWRTRVRGGW